MSNLTVFFFFFDNNALPAQATASSAAITVPVVVATTPTITTSTAEKKITKRKMSELRDGWKDSAGKLHSARHFDYMSYHKTLSTIIW